MATIRKVGNYQWEVEVRRKNYPRVSKTFAYKQDAESWGRDQETAMKSGTWVDPRLEVPQDPITTPLRIIINKYIEEESPKKLGGAREIVRLKKWLTHPLADRPLAKCFPSDFASYISVRRKDISTRGGPIAEQTIKLEIIAISNVFEVARKDWGYNIANPIKSISKPKGSGTREARILPDDWKKIAAELRKCRNAHFLVIAEFAIETGMRQGEIFRMTWQDIEMKKRLVTVLGKDTSTIGQHKKRLVPLSFRALELLQALPRSIKNELPVFKGSSANGLSRAFKKACVTSNVDSVIVFHSTRHEAASRMAPHYHMLTLMKIFGWKTPSMAARYYHTSEDELLAGIDRMGVAAQAL